MTDYREILRLSSLGINHSKIAESMGIARQTVVTTLQRAVVQELNWGSAEARNWLPGSTRPATPPGTKCRTTKRYTRRWPSPA